MRIFADRLLSLAIEMRIIFINAYLSLSVVFLSFNVKRKRYVLSEKLSSIFVGAIFLLPRSLV